MQTDSEYILYGYKNGKWQAISSGSGNSYVLKNLKAGKDYKVFVAAKVNGKWINDPSNAIIVTPKRRSVKCFTEIGLNPPESIEELNRLFNAWLSECYHNKVHSALGITPETAFKSDSMPLYYPDEAILASAFLHCETRKVNRTNKFAPPAASALWARTMTSVYCTQVRR